MCACVRFTSPGSIVDAYTYISSDACHSGPFLGEAHRMFIVLESFLAQNAAARSALDVTYPHAIVFQVAGALPEPWRKSNAMGRIWSFLAQDGDRSLATFVREEVDAVQVGCARRDVRCAMCAMRACV